MDNENIASFSQRGKLRIDKDFYDKNIRLLGFSFMYYVLLKAHNSPYKTREGIRFALGISRATEHNWRKKLKNLGFL